MPAWAGGPSRKSWGSTTMAVSGIILLFFLISHIATLKYGAYYATAEPVSPGSSGTRYFWTNTLGTIYTDPAAAIGDTVGNSAPAAGPLPLQ